MAEPADIRDETCTNLSILLKLLIRNIKPGEAIPLIVTRKQLIMIEEILVQHNISVHHEPLPEDLLVTVSRPAILSEHQPHSR
jgi:hypothetical protein